MTVVNRGVNTDSILTLQEGKIAIGDLFSKHLASGDLNPAEGTIAIGDLETEGFFAIGDPDRGYSCNRRSKQ